jgi:FkbM family methyltransferase
MKNSLSLTNYMPDDMKANFRHPKTALKYLFDDIKIAVNRKFFGSFSQHSEDLIIAKLLKDVQNGFYVDIGANDPEVISNTRYFYDRGWRGINIEPHPEMYQRILEKRQEDINLNIGVASEEGELIFYKLDKINETAGSTFDKNVAEALTKKGYVISAEIKMSVIPLSKVLRSHLNNKKIDFMSVDTEGFDLEVIKSNDWTTFRPKILIVETNINKDQIIDFVLAQNYKIVYQNLANTIFKDTN